MIIFVVITGIIALSGLRFRVPYTKILSKKDTTIINAIFVLCILFSHSSQYICLDETSFLNSLYRHFQNFHNQWVVATFLAFSGFGVMSQIKSEKNGGGGYVLNFPRKRILKTLFNFDIAIIIYMILNLMINNSYTPLEYVGSLIGLTSIGNSNWYIFAILFMYMVSYIAARIFKDNYKRQAMAVILGMVIYIIIMEFTGMPSRFISTISCYPLGVCLSLYKNEVIELFRKKKWISILVLLILLGATYKLRYNDYIMNFASCIFVITIVWVVTFFEIKSKILYFIGQHAFSIFILQRIPMLIFNNYGIFENTSYIFVIVSLFITIVLSVGFDKVINKIDKVLF